MLKNGVLLLIAALSTVPLVPDVSAAQQISSPYRFLEQKQDLGLFFGYVKGDPGGADLGPDGGPTYGLQYSTRLSDPIGIGAYFAYLDSERDVVNPRGENGAESIGRTSQDLVLITGRLMFSLTGARTWHKIVPYLLGGIGIAIDVTGNPSCVLDRSDIECQIFPEDRYNFDKSFLAQFGAGFVWLPTQRFGLRFTFHDNFWRISAPDGFFDPEAMLDPVPPDAEWTNNLQLTAGLQWWF